jgi:hypothetical protein
MEGRELDQLLPALHLFCQSIYADSLCHLHIIPAKLQLVRRENGPSKVQVRWKIQLSWDRLNSGEGSGPWHSAWLLPQSWLC